MAQELIDLVEQFCIYQRKQRGHTEGGVKTYRWNLEQFLGFVRRRAGRLPRLADLTTPTTQGWLDDMAAGDLGVNTMRCRLSTLSSFCAWLVKRGVLPANPTLPIDRPPREAAMPIVAGPPIMDALIEAAKRRGRPRDLAIFLLLRYTGMRRASVASLRVRHLDEGWGLRGVRVKGGKTQDLPLPAAVMVVLKLYVERVLTPECEKVTPDTPLFWSTWGRRRVGKTRQPMAGKNIWRLCKIYGRLIGYPELRPHASDTAWRSRSWSNGMISRKCARSSATRASTRPRSTRASGRPSSSGRSRSTRRTRSGCWRTAPRSRLKARFEA